ncbi:hypothetical protein [Streptomyces xiamenensis]|uniref:hypothetical protein n=1 Tax=Streptomyces xiamenensis TaxID=408015 RepID=UPI0035E2A5C8
MTFMLEQTSDPYGLFVSVQVRPDGRPGRVQATTYQPGTDWGRSIEVKTAVFEIDPTALALNHQAQGRKILDLALSHTTPDDNPQLWAQGEDEERRYMNTGRRQLREIEAHLVLAGYTECYTGVVGCQDFGVTIKTPRNIHLLLLGNSGWTHHLAHSDGDATRWARIADKTALSTHIAARFAESIRNYEEPHKATGA